MFNRHDILILNAEGRREAVQNLKVLGNHFHLDHIKRLQELIGQHEGTGLPAVVRRIGEDEMPGNGVAVGFSSPFRIDNMRMRGASFVNENGIAKLITPYQVFKAGCEGTGELSALLNRLPAYADQRMVGLWGAAAQQIITGMRCLHDDSDIDLLVKGFSLEQLREFKDEIAALQISFDVEVILRNGCGVKLAELLSDSKTYLVKGIHEVSMLRQSCIYAML